MPDAELTRGLQRRLLVREANYEIRKLNLRFGIRGEELSVLCECCRPDCIERVELPLARLDAALVHERAFVVRPGHDEPRVDAVAETGASYVVVTVTDEAWPLVTSVSRGLWSHVRVTERR